MDKNNNIDQLFNTVKQQPVEYSFDQAKERFINSVGKNEFSKGKEIKHQLFTTKKWIFMFLTVATVALSFLLLNPSDSISKNNKDTKVKLKTVNKSSEVIQFKKVNEVKVLKVINEKVISIDPLIKSNLTDSNEVVNQYITPTIIEANILQTEKVIQQHLKLDDEYPFPKLTEDEIKANHKKKKEMIKAFSKIDPDVFSYVPSGTFEINGKMTSVQSFIIQKTEVSNLEYKTFLFDLLIQGRKSDFLIAKPDQHKWVSEFDEGMKTMEELYFSHPAYDNYPVVNVSREGAEMYCKWFSENVYAFNTAKNPNYYVDLNKVKYFSSSDRIFCDIRLPLIDEWVYAASSTNQKISKYPWGDSLTNEKGCYLANFQPKKDSLFLDGGFHTVKVTSYIPNKYALYCMSGNVSEMIYYSVDKVNHRLIEPGTAGGNWMSSENEIKILSDDKLKGEVNPSPFIGFRIVSTKIGRW